MNHPQNDDLENKGRKNNGLKNDDLKNDDLKNDDLKNDDLKNDDRWREQLTPAAYAVCRQKGTERAFTGALLNEKRQGTYHCACCGEPLFASDSKFDSGSGWPSFFEKITDEAVAEHRDNSHGMLRTEVVCKKCDSHLGHVFPDGPVPTGLRYCINSLSLAFTPTQEPGA